MRIPSTSNTRQSGIQQGTMGGQSAGPVGNTPRNAGGTGQRPGMQLGDEMYLWLLVAAEVGVLAYLRNAFRRYHGG